MSEGNNPPKSFYWTAGLALVWNLFGIMAYVNQVTMSPEVLAALPDAQRAFFESQPTWVTSAFAIAVNAGTLGCLLLLLRKSWALPVFVLSTICVLTQTGYNYFVADGMAVFGASSLAVPISIIVISAYLIWFSMNAKNKGWIS